MAGSTKKWNTQTKSTKTKQSEDWVVSEEGELWEENFSCGSEGGVNEVQNHFYMTKADLLPRFKTFTAEKSIRLFPMPQRHRNSNKKLRISCHDADKMSESANSRNFNN